MVTFYRRVYHKKGLWLSKYAFRRWAKGRYTLHSQSVQALADKLDANFEMARRRGRCKTGFPYKL